VAFTKTLLPLKRYVAQTGCCFLTGVSSWGDSVRILQVPLLCCRLLPLEGSSSRTNLGFCEIQFRVVRKLVGLTEPLVFCLLNLLVIPPSFLSLLLHWWLTVSTMPNSYKARIRMSRPLRVPGGKRARTQARPRCRGALAGFRSVALLLAVAQ